MGKLGLPTKLGLQAKQGFSIKQVQWTCHDMDMLGLPTKLELQISFIELIHQENKVPYSHTKCNTISLLLGHSVCPIHNQCAPHMNRDHAMHIDSSI